MEFSIVFEKTGDSLPFVAINPDVVEYYVDCLSQHNLNSFFTDDPGYAKSVNSKITKLHQGLLDANVWISELFDQTLDTFNHEDYLDQNNLNHLHAEWVKLHSHRYDIDQKRTKAKFQGLPEFIHTQYPDSERFPKFGDVVSKIEKTRSFDQLNNPFIHGIESSFSNVVFKCTDNWIEFNNPFPKTLTSLNSCNLFLPFRHLGRSQYNKFTNFDFDLTYNDENTFNELIGFVGLSLNHPQSISYSKEYINWCKQHARELTGEKIPLGNIPDLLANLKKYRIIVFRNTMAGHKFRIDLHKG